MKLSQWARNQGVTYKTAWRWFRAGLLPVPVRQLPTGTILVEEPVPLGERGAVAIYARVSSADQQQDLDRQVARLVSWANEQKMAVGVTVTEIGSGLNGRRSKLLKLLSDPKVGTIVVEHRDRLMRFGSEYVEAALRASGRKLVVVDSEELNDDLVQDMIDVLTSFCARLSGRRSARNRALKALEAVRS